MELEHALQSPHQRIAQLRYHAVPDPVVKTGLRLPWRSLLLAWVWLLTACTIPIAYYDATTYKNLTDLKAEAMTLIESFDTVPFKRNESRVEQLQLSFRKAYEYELGKGAPNSDTAKQFTKLKKLIDDAIRDYRDSQPGELGAKYFEQAAGQLGQAFDIAIRTENEKNANKR